MGRELTVSTLHRQQVGLMVCTAHRHGCSRSSGLVEPQFTFEAQGSGRQTKRGNGMKRKFTVALALVALAAAVTTASSVAGRRRRTGSPVYPTRATRSARAST